MVFQLLGESRIYHMSVSTGFPQSVCVTNGNFIVNVLD